MALPGFTALASLPTTRATYPQRLVRRPAGPSKVVPQQAGCPRTTTACPLGGIFGLWCRDYCFQTPISGWYPCGICFGGDI
jgi:hypothetical protein